MTEDRRRRIVYAAIIISAAVLVGLCAGLWGISVEAKEPYPVVINEVLAGNTLYSDAAGELRDFVELYNSGAESEDISLWQLTDGGSGKRYIIPEGTVLSAGEYYVVYCRKDGGDDAAPFGISRAGGENIRLLTPKGAVADEMVTVSTVENESQIRLEDGTWTTSMTPTPGTANELSGVSETYGYNPGVSDLRISELMTSNSSYPRADGVRCDWVELWNTGSEPVDAGGYTLSDDMQTVRFTFPQGTVVEAGGYLVVWCSSGLEGAAQFGLSRDGGEVVTLKDPQGRIADAVETLKMATDQSQSLEEDGTWVITECATPGFANTPEGREAYRLSIGWGQRTVEVTEFMASNHATLAAPDGHFYDWVELTNNGSDTVNLCGWGLSDDPEDPYGWTFPSIELGSGERIIVFCSGLDGEMDGFLHTNFSLSADGESLTLTTPLGVTASSIDYGRQEADVSFNMDSESGMQWTSQSPSPGYANTPEGSAEFYSSLMPAGPLAIWEVLAENESVYPQAYGRCYDYVELRNISSVPLELSDFAITDDTDFPALFPLPEGELAPGESVVVLLSGESELTTSRSIHAPFGLDGREDRLYLYCGDELIDYVLLRDQQTDVSYGRMEGEGGFVSMPPTPGEDNERGETS